LSTQTSHLIPSRVPAGATAARRNTRVDAVAVVPLVQALGAGGGVRVGSATLPAVVLAALSVGAHAAVVLVVAGVLATLLRAGSAVRRALVGIGEGVELEAVACLVVGVDVVAGQAWKRDVANGRAGGVTFAWVVWLLADVGVGRDRDTASA
jgi:hypothetical protein